jgi:hypothetical protein
VTTAIRKILRQRGRKVRGGQRAVSVVGEHGKAPVARPSRQFGRIPAETGCLAGPPREPESGDDPQNSPKLLLAR